MFPYIGYVPVRESVHDARWKVELLCRAIIDRRAVFAAIWDPMLYIVFPMLEPRPIATQRVKMYEFAGRLYHETAAPCEHDFGYVLSRGSLTHPRRRGSAPCLHGTRQVVDNPSRWTAMFVGSDLILARMRD